MTEAFYTTPDQLKTEFQNKYGIYLTESEKEWRHAFEKVPLKETVNRDNAFKLVMITLDYFEKKFFSNLEKKNDLKETQLQDYIEESNRFLSMIRFEIEK